jgi:hypothetical protein
VLYVLDSHVFIYDTSCIARRVEKSHSREALGYLERDIRMDQCFYCYNKPIKESTIHKHTRIHHMKPAIDEFIQYQCERYREYN